MKRKEPSLKKEVVKGEPFDAGGRNVGCLDAFRGMFRKIRNFGLDVVSSTSVHCVADC